MLGRFAKLSASEKRLSVAVAVLIAAAILMLVGVRCNDALDLLDETVASQELALLDLSHYAALAGPVDEAYSATAQQHSSEWTQEEIHDRLRVEIARLSLRDLPQEGAALPAVSKPGDLLVDIRSWPMGALDDSGEGYRTYQIKFKTEPASIQNIAAFLERLQRSPQALRVDYLELLRQPLSTAVSAELRVTRTVIGEPGKPQQAAAAQQAPVERTNRIEDADFAQMESTGGAVPQWSVSGGVISAEKDIVPGGGTALAMRAEGPGSELAYVHDLRAGAEYELSFVARASGAAVVRIANEAGASLGGDAPLAPGSVSHEYRFRFTAPGTGGAAVSMRAPSFVAADSGTVVSVDNVSLMETGP